MRLYPQYIRFISQRNLCARISYISTKFSKINAFDNHVFMFLLQKSYPEKLLYQCSCLLILLAIPFRILYLATKNITFGYVEDGLVSLAIPGTFLYFLYFGRIYTLTGAFIVMIFEMITGDIATFGVIYVIVITAFGQG